MSSKTVRDSINTFLTTSLPGEKIFDLTAEGKEMQDFIDSRGTDFDTDWYGLQFEADPEIPVSVPATNTSGKWREEGLVFVHIVTPVVTDTAIMKNNLVDRAEIIKNLLRGKRIDGIIILTVGQPNFESGATLEFEGGFQSCSMIINYQKDLNL